jgi:hypothetical protein
MSSDEFVAAVRQRRKGAFSAAQLEQLRAKFNRAIAPIRHELQVALVLQREINDAANGAYGLASDEIDLLWRTAPPRTPITG